MNKKEIKPEQLRELRTRIVLSIVAKFPYIYRKLYSDKGYVMTEKEDIAAQVLKGLLDADPIIKRLLDFYKVGDFK
jgi:hypothetical protein